MAKLMAIDPGDVHVGLAAWERLELSVGEEYSRWKAGKDPHPWIFVDAWEIDADIMPDPLLSYRPNIVVCERYHLHPWRARAQSFSQMPTSQMIGVIRHVCDTNEFLFVEQGSEILRLIRKTPFYREHREKHGTPDSPHAESALSHGLYYIHMGKGSK